MKYPRHLKDRRSILLQEPRDIDLMDDDLEYLRAAYDSQHNNLTDKVMLNSESDGIQPASPSIVR